MSSQPNTIIVVPRRADNGHRDELWNFCRTWWETKFPWWQIYEGFHTDGPFNRSAAVNAAVAACNDQWDVAVIIDADIMPNALAAATAANVAFLTGSATLSHTARLMLNRNATAMFLVGNLSQQTIKNKHLENVFYDSVSCCIAVPKKLWEAVGGFDERFVGWGFEDSAFALACETFQEHPILRIESELIHLWHPVETGNTLTGPKTPEAAKLMEVNANLLNLYRNSRYNLEKMKNIK